MKIGELAKATNCHAETIRYYHKVKLLFKPETMANGYGRYTDKHLSHLRLLRRSKELGFSQKEMGELIGLANNSSDSCSNVHRLTIRQIGEIERKIHDLEKIKIALTELRTACENNAIEDCPALTDMLTFEDLK